jgi:hypothetical protein
MTLNTRHNEKFEYHVEDLDCLYCQYYKPENRDNKTGCGLNACRFEDIRQDAVANNRIERERGWFKWSR